jgi:FixJ family two-component response regulator
MHLPSTPIVSIVDDDASARIGTVRLVRSVGYITQAFPSALAFLNSEHLTETECLILDIQMPEMDGFELHDALRARGHTIPMILITAFPEDNIRTRALARGAICFLSKPFDSEALLRCLDMALKGDVGS